MKFKFRGVQVWMTDGRLKCKDEATKDLLTPLVKCAHGGPEDGHPFLNLLTGIFSHDAVTDVEYTEKERNVIH